MCVFKSQADICVLTTDKLDADIFFYNRNLIKNQSIAKYFKLWYNLIRW
jgi:hypothetical protein